MILHKFYTSSKSTLPKKGMNTKKSLINIMSIRIKPKIFLIQRQEILKLTTKQLTVHTLILQNPLIKKI